MILVVVGLLVVLSAGAVGRSCATYEAPASRLIDTIEELIPASREAGETPDETLDRILDLLRRYKVKEEKEDARS